MEDIKQYIESGVLELYILDSLSPEEKLEVEGMAAKYPFVQKELDEIAETMELFAEQHAIEPHEGLRATVLNQLVGNNTTGPVSATRPDTLSDKKVVPLKPVHLNHFYKYAFAASIALLLVSLAALFNTYNRLQQSRSQLLGLQLQNQKFANQVNFQENQLNQYRNANQPTSNIPVATDSIIRERGNTNELVALKTALNRSKSKIAVLELESKNREREANIFYDPDSRFIKLKGNGSNAGSALLIAWNPEKNKLYINKKNSGLAKNDKNHQYQLWAIRKLKPISLGVFDIDKKDSMIQSMLSIDKAAAFAVTLEPRGGSKKPTLTKMMAMSISHK